MTRQISWTITYPEGLEEYSGKYTVRSWSIREKEQVKLVGITYSMPVDLTQTPEVKEVDNGEKAVWQIKRALVEAPFSLVKFDYESLPAEVGEDILDVIQEINTISKKAKRKYIG